MRNRMMVVMALAVSLWGQEPGRVSAPRLIHKVEPEYSEAARKRRVQGRDMKAVEAVRQWRFQPGVKDGEPVAVTAKLEVNFRLLN
jgi:protein TonB